MNGVQEQQFLEVKQKLDYYRLPAIFPIEATSLIHRLLKLVQKYRTESGQNNPGSSNISAGQNVVDGAIRKEMGKVIKQNNKLHLDLITTKQEIQSLKHCLDKIAIEKSSNQKDTEKVLALKTLRENQLFEELTRVKYRYNELLDMVHEDPHVQKLYIKRLYKHKRYDITSSEQMQETTDPHSKRKQNISGSSEQLQRKIEVLENKLHNRQTEILRLQSRLQYDGINLNKVLKDFNNETTGSRVSALNQQLEYLEQENKKMKDEVAKTRGKGGLKEALREEVRKNHQQIKRLDEDNKLLRRKLKQTNFDGDARHKSGKRDAKVAQERLKEEQSIKGSLEGQVSNLEKKTEFYAKEADHFKHSVNILEKELLKKDITIEQLKNRDAENRILEKYELQNLRKKIQESDQLMRELMGTNKMIADENTFYREQGHLKSQAIENLQNIVQQLKRRHVENQQSLRAVNELKQNQRDELDLMRQIVDLKQQLVHAQNQKLTIETDYNRVLTELDRFDKDRIALIDEVNRLKIRIADERNLGQSTIILKKELEQARLLIRRQETARIRAQSIVKELEHQKQELRRQLTNLGMDSRTNQKVLRNEINQKQIKIAELDQANNILGMRVQEKEMKMRFYEEKISECQSKIKNLADEVVALEDEKHLIAKDKHRAQKRYQELAKQQELGRQRELQLINISQNQHATQVVWLKKEINGLSDKNSKYVEAYSEMADLVSILRREKDQLNLDKINYMRENDHLRMRIQQAERQLSLRLAR